MANEFGGQSWFSKVGEWSKGHWYHFVLLALTTAISVLVANFKQSAFIASFAFPLLVELALLVYENAAKAILKRQADAHGVIEEVFSLFYDISTSGEAWREKAIEAAKGAVNRCREDLINIKAGRLPINPFGTTGEAALAESDKYLYEIQRKLIAEAKRGEDLLSIHCADTIGGQKRWDPQTYGPDGGNPTSSFYTYIIKANEDAANRGVNVRRLFITVDHRLFSDEASRTRLRRLEEYQQKLGIKCRFIEQETVKQLKVQADDILIAPSAAVSFKEQGWTARAYEIVDEARLAEERDLFEKLWKEASETFEGLFGDGK